MIDVKALLTKILGALKMGSLTSVTLPYTATSDGLLVESHRTNGGGNSYVQLKIGSDYYIGQAYSGWVESHVWPVHKGDTITLAAQNSATDISYKFIKWGG